MLYFAAISLRLFTSKVPSLGSWGVYLICKQFWELKRNPKIVSARSFDETEIVNDPMGTAPSLLGDVGEKILKFYSACRATQVPKC